MPVIDALSYHYYGMLSQRCSGSGTPDEALSEAWLSGTDGRWHFTESFETNLEPGKPIWLTETAEAACGGNPVGRDASWIRSAISISSGGWQEPAFRSSCTTRWRRAITACSTSGRLQPRPNYWGALLWRQLMGTTVLDAGLPASIRTSRLRPLSKGHAGRRVAAGDQYRPRRAARADASDATRCATRSTPPICWMQQIRLNGHAAGAIRRR